ncbi:DUF3081 family protein [Shewanella sp. NIFS-20-20]|uniref:DUF3081 family protein n=1 Tax=Shewanella sp. NIFS-20-20 TaxID=2853806 RepID=UPI001C4530EA|nr:DUF3081 family protein [Shewanella sp. NIFS-20-20]MBV7314681.1 DUF3081 domain-containing protein [Shewanella sp. NIFS-20-20]
MHNELDLRWALSLAGKIRDKGELVSGNDEAALVYRLAAITLETDSDGYTIKLTDGRVDLTLFFHHKYELDYPDASALDSFMAKLHELDNTLPQ